MILDPEISRVIYRVDLTEEAGRSSLFSITRARKGTCLSNSVALQIPIPPVLSFLSGVPLCSPQFSMGELSAWQIAKFLTFLCSKKRFIVRRWDLETSLR